MIDDDEDEYFFLQYAFNKLGLNAEVDFVNSYHTKPTEISLENKPDIAFIDFNMPRHNGHDWIKELKAQGYEFPMIMYSTSRSDETIKTSFEAGADVYVEKASNMDGFICCLKKVLTLDWARKKQIKDKIILKSEKISPC